MRYAIVQIGKRKFIVAEQACRGGTYRKLCECDTEHCAKIIKDALVKGDPNALRQAS